MTLDAATDEAPARMRAELRVLGWGTELPPRVVEPDEIQRLVAAGTTRLPVAERIEAATGVRTRRWAADGIQGSDLAAAAGRRALSMAGYDAADIGLLIYAAVSAEVFEPAVAHIVQEKLGATRATAFDIRAGSNSFLYALNTVSAMTDERRPILLTSGEVLSRRIRSRFDSPVDLERGLVGLAAGDAGAAFLVQRRDPDTAMAALPYGRFVTQGQHRRTAFVAAGGAQRGNDLSEDDLKVDVDAFDRCIAGVLPRLLGDVVSRCGWEGEEVLVVSNLSAGRAARVVEGAGLILGGTLSSVETHGDTGAASIPLAIGIAADEGRLRRGQRIVQLGAAAGFSGAAVPLVW
jgi:acyl-CoA:acyl-CoA alkyltransferase